MESSTLGLQVFGWVIFSLRVTKCSAFSKACSTDRAVLCWGCCPKNAVVRMLKAFIRFLLSLAWVGIDPSLSHASSIWGKGVFWQGILFACKPFQSEVSVGWIRRCEKDKMFCWLGTQWDKNCLYDCANCITFEMKLALFILRPGEEKYQSDCTWRSICSLIIARTDCRTHDLWVWHTTQVGSGCFLPLCNDGQWTPPPPFWASPRRKLKIAVWGRVTSELQTTKGGFLSGTSE